MHAHLLALLPVRGGDHLVEQGQLQAVHHAQGLVEVPPRRHGVLLQHAHAAVNIYANRERRGPKVALRVYRFRSHQVQEPANLGVVVGDDGKPNLAVLSVTTIQAKKVESLLTGIGADQIINELPRPGALGYLRPTFGGFLWCRRKEPQAYTREQRTRLLIWTASRAQWLPPDRTRT